MLIIKDLRKQKKLSQQQVSEQLGITRVALSHYETGKRDPNLHMLQKLSEFYNVSIDYISGCIIIAKRSCPATVGFPKCS